MRRIFLVSGLDESAPPIKARYSGVTQIVGKPRLKFSIRTVREEMRVSANKHELIENFRSEVFVEFSAWTLGYYETVYSWRTDFEPLASKYVGFYFENLKNIGQINITIQDILKKVLTISQWPQ